MPPQAFDVALAHSMFTHVPEDALGECFAHLHRVLKPSGVFFATFGEGPRGIDDKATGSFNYPCELFQSLCDRYGYSLSIDEELKHPHKQKMMVITPRLP